MIKDQSKWSEFEKKEVSNHLPRSPPCSSCLIDCSLSSSQRSLRNVISTSRSTAAVFVAQTFTLSLVAGVNVHFQSALATKL